MFRYPRKDWAVTSGMARLDQLAKRTVRSDDCHVVAYIAACSDLHISAGLWRSNALFVVHLRDVVARIARSLWLDRRGIRLLHQR